MHRLIGGNTAKPATRAVSFLQQHLTTIVPATFAGSSVPLKHSWASVGFMLGSAAAFASSRRAGPTTPW
jgi:hypothetical protein